MIVRDLATARGGPREVDGGNWISRRLLLKEDGMGFSLHDTEVRAGTSTRMCYRNHLEAVYCVAGEGSLENLATGETHPVRDGIVYALDAHDEHVLHARTTLRVVCVFNPPLVGPEVHDATGAYPAMASDG